MDDMTVAIVPKSDQINAEDLLVDSITIEITNVEIDMRRTQQPVWISFAGSKKFYRPSKTMCRVMAIVWGANEKSYNGKSLTLYRDPDVKYGALATGGIKISHMSHLSEERTLVLSERRGIYKPHTVRPILYESDQIALAAACAAIAAMTDKVSCEAAKALSMKLSGADRKQASELYTARIKALQEPQT